MGITQAILRSLQIRETVRVTQPPPTHPSVSCHKEIDNGRSSSFRSPPLPAYIAYTARGERASNLVQNGTQIIKPGAWSAIFSASSLNVTPSSCKFINRLSSATSAHIAARWKILASSASATHPSSPEIYISRANENPMPLVNPIVPAVIATVFALVTSGISATFQGEAGEGAL